eukprot:986574-Rhodomonas_salina.1
MGSKGAGVGGAWSRVRDSKGKASWPSLSLAHTSQLTNEISQLGYAHNSASLAWDFPVHTTQPPSPPSCSH